MILALIEHHLENNRSIINNGSLEMLTAAGHLAAELHCPLEAVSIEGDAETLSQILATYGVSKLHHVTDQANQNRLNQYAPEAWAQSIIHLSQTTSPQAILAAATDRGNEVMAHLGAKTNLPLAVNCIHIQPGDSYTVTRQRWGGSLLEEATLSGEPKLLTIALHTIMAAEASTPSNIVVNTVTPTLSDRDFRVQVVDHVQATSDKISLSAARVVVGGGRGVGSAEGFAVLEELANILGGAIGVSRAVTNHGWRPHADQIGQTGTRIAPDIYIACGISGAMQHIVGCKGAKHTLVINTDPDAPFIAKADYAVIGDLHQVVPALSKAIKELTS